MIYWLGVSKTHSQYRKSTPYTYYMIWYDSASYRPQHLSKEQWLIIIKAQMCFIFFMDLLFYIIIKITQKQYFQFDYLKKQKEEITKNCRSFWRYGNIISWKVQLFQTLWTDNFKNKIWVRIHKISSTELIQNRIH